MLNPSNKLSFSIYIISWKDQHTNAMKIFDEINSTTSNITIVYSDPNPNFRFPSKYNTIKRENHLFWGDKFKACIDDLKTDIMLIIHGDCRCNDWKSLVENSLKSHTLIPNTLVWAPLIKGTHYPLELTKMYTINNTPLEIVAQTDAIVFSLHKDLVQKMKDLDYSKNIYGWGIDWFFVSYTYMINKLVVVDSSIEVVHPKKRDYDEKKAIKQMQPFLEQASLPQTLQLRLLHSYVTSKR